MNLDDMRAEMRREVQAEILAAIDQLIAIYTTGVPALPNHPINHDAKVAIDILSGLRQGIEMAEEQKNE